MTDQTPNATPTQHVQQPWDTPNPTSSSATNVLAIVSLIGAFVFPLAGVICGHIALSQIKRTGDRGHGLAVAGLVVGYLYIAFIMLAVFGSFILSLAAASNNAYSY